jgi:hypothetical protein
VELDLGHAWLSEPYLGPVVTHESDRFVHRPNMNPNFYLLAGNFEIGNNMQLLIITSSIWNDQNENGV